MKKSNIIILLVIVIAIGIIFSLADNVSTYEAFNSPKTLSGVEVHVVGFLDRDKEMEYNPEEDANYFSFYMKDTVGDTRKVVYMDGKPRDFEKSEKLVLVGELKGEEFLANNILMKCPSKYVEEKNNVATKDEN